MTRSRNTMVRALGTERCAADSECGHRRSGGEQPVAAAGSHEGFGVVRAENLERELALVRRSAAGPLAGIFGPSSLSWRIHRESAVFLGAGRTLLLQLAHPMIAAAIERHSQTFANPIGRFHRTFSIVFTFVFGKLEASLQAARRLQVVGGEGAGVKA